MRIGLSQTPGQPTEIDSPSKNYRARSFLSPLRARAAFSLNQSRGRRAHGFPKVENAQPPLLRRRLTPWGEPATVSSFVYFTSTRP